MVTCRGLCPAHYNRQRKYGHPLKQPCGCGCKELVDIPAHHLGIIYIAGHGIAGGPLLSPEQKLKEGVVLQPVSTYGANQHGLTDDCHIWTGGANEQGYGKLYLRLEGVKRRGEIVLAHRLAYELQHGARAMDGLTIDHLCRVRLCCNLNHLEAVPHSTNTSRASATITACPRGHPYDEENTFYSRDGHRKCRQCSVATGHFKTHGHEFVRDPSNPSTKKSRCLICRRAAELVPAFCPAGHEFTPENTEQGNSGRRCLQCRLNSHHVPLYGNEFVVDPGNPNAKRRRCLTCVQNQVVPSRCPAGHEFTPENTGHGLSGRRCLKCERDAHHIPTYGHEFISDPSNPSQKKARCLTCRQLRGLEGPSPGLDQ